MKRSIIATLAATTVLATSAGAFAQSMSYSSVETKTELEAVDSNALTYWPEISADVDMAVLGAIDPMMVEDGNKVEVAIEEISLGGTTMLNAQGEFNTLIGEVRIYTQDDALVDSFPVSLTAEVGSLPMMPQDAIVVAPSRADFYDAMVGVFANDVAERLVLQGNIQEMINDSPNAG
ncbi:hypothetical protein AQS8620_01488 [Aquimixticola soesokkakensis]|uniref:Polyketide cyclase / dehydrase and lipid transport n=1 Tax=Aquimixticola soesokkakensis TaxID=1519096 RepID=A0A1Y5SIA9_9RHOB|nr:hypothetical protein [Aquimixticola soesokkakensis]SLN39776.1 hypothetical protein AQS8620_01488 [Aquimixticola soesokkakensis]